MMNKFITLILMVLICPVFGGGDSVKDSDRVSEALYLLNIWMQAERDYDEIPGLSVAVVHDQELVWSKGYGFTDLAETRPVTPRSIYSICSISKLFTSIAALQLRDRGLLRLDDPVSKHLPWFQIRQTQPQSGPVTVQNVLTHSSGLPRESDYPYWSAPDFAFPTHEEIVRQIENQKMLYEADTYFQYSNLGLTLAGEIVAAVSGQHYDAYVTEHILQPLGLQDTNPWLPEEERGKRFPTGYSAETREGKREPVKFFDAKGIAPAAGFSSTVEDLAKFAMWQFRVLAGKDSTVLARNTLREMQRVQWLDPDWETYWGLGFSIWRSKDKTFVGHGGSCPGFRSQLLLSPEDKVAVVVMANASGLNTRAYAQNAYEIVAPAFKEAGKESEMKEEDTDSYDQYTGLYSVRPWGGEIAVFIWKDELGTVGLPNSDPAGNITRLKHIEGNTFRRIRDDDELGEEIVFEIDFSISVKECGDEKCELSFIRYFSVCDGFGALELRAAC